MTKKKKVRGSIFGVLIGKTYLRLREKMVESWKSTLECAWVLC